MYELMSGTDVASHAIYDPAATTHLNFETDNLGDLLYVDEPRKGNLLLYDVASDGSTFYRIYIDEEMPDALTRHANKSASNLLLKVPSGVLVAGGLEYLNDQREIAKAKAFVPGEHSLVTKISIPPGNYIVDAYELDWDWDRHIDPVLRREAEPGRTRETWIGPATGCGLFGTFFAAVVTLISIFVDGWDPQKLVWVAIPAVLLVISGFLFWLLIPKDYWKKKDEISARFPPNVLVMKLVAEGTNVSQLRGGGFGFAAVERLNRKA